MKQDAPFDDHRFANATAGASRETDRARLDPPANFAPSSLSTGSDEDGEAASFPQENPNPVFRVTPDGRLLYANPASGPLLAVWGVDARGVLPDDWRGRVAEVLAAGEPRKWDTPCGERILQLHCVPIAEAGYVNVYGADVTERAALLSKLADERRRLAEEVTLAEQRAAELQATLVATNDGIALYDLRGRLRLMNRTAEEMLGDNPGEIGLSLADRATLIRASIVECPDARVEEFPLPRALRGEAVRGEFMRFERPGQVDGEETYVLASAVPIRDAAARPSGAAVSFTDITARVRAESEMAAALEAVLISERKYRALFDSIDEGFCVIEVLFDDAGKAVDYLFLEANPAFERHTGLADAMGRRVRDMLPLHEEHWFEIYGKIALTGEPARFENAAEQLGRYFDVYAFRIGNPAERKVAVLFNDISRRKQAEAERERLWLELQARQRELEAQAEEIRALNAGLEQRVQARTAELEAIFASVPDALYVADGASILRANAAAVEAFGSDSVQELKAELSTLERKMRPRDADTGELIPSGELALARALRGERAVLEITTCNPRSGEDQIHRVAAGPIVLGGQVVAAVAHATDITEQKRAQQQLAYQANLLANVNDVILAYDDGFRVTAWNARAEELYGWTAAEAIGSYAPAITGSRMADGERAAVRLQLVETGRWQGEVRHTRRDGTPIIVESTSMALRDKTGRVTGFVTVNRDVTARKEAEAENARLLEEVTANRAQLRALSRRLVELQEAERSYVADQLYNQAVQVLAAVQLQLARAGRADGEAAQLLPTIRATLNEAIHELHDLASALRPVGLDRLPLAKVLASYLDDFGKSQGLATRFDFRGEDGLRLNSDAGTAIFRGVQEGLTNVARHALATEVTLSLSQDESWVKVTLTDDGVGFDSGAGTSAGLGLAGIRERMTALGGEVCVRSGPGGTTLQLSAPLAPIQTEQA
jgi:PAS domain S-box-containing protein